MGFILFNDKNFLDFIRKNNYTTFYVHDGHVYNIVNYQKIIGRDVNYKFPLYVDWVSYTIAPKMGDNIILLRNKYFDGNNIFDIYCFNTIYKEEYYQHSCKVVLQYIETKKVVYDNYTKKYSFYKDEFTVDLNPLNWIKDLLKKEQKNYRFKKFIIEN